MLLHSGITMSSPVYLDFMHARVHKREEVAEGEAGA